MRISIPNMFKFHTAINRGLRFHVNLIFKNSIGNKRIVLILSRKGIVRGFSPITIIIFPNALTTPNLFFKSFSKSPYQKCAN